MASRGLLIEQFDIHVVAALLYHLAGQLRAKPQGQSDRYSARLAAAQVGAAAKGRCLSFQCALVLVIMNFRPVG